MSVSHGSPERRKALQSPRRSANASEDGTVQRIAASYAAPTISIPAPRMAETPVQSAAAVKPPSTKARSRQVGRATPECPDVRVMVMASGHVGERPPPARSLLPGLRQPSAPGAAARGAAMIRGIGGSTLRGDQTVFHGIHMWGQLFRVAMLFAAFTTVAVPA